MRSIWLRSRYSARLKGPPRFSSHFLGMVMRILQRRRLWRMAWLLYALSAASRRGRSLGRPGPLFLTAPCAMRASKPRVSCHCPGVSTSAIGRPRPSLLRWTLVENPPRLLPSASRSGSPLLHRPHAGAHALWCCRRSGSPSRSPPHSRPARAERPRSAPTPQRGSSGRSGLPRCARTRSARASLSREHPCGAPTGCRSGCGGDPAMGARSWASAAAASDRVAPTVRPSSLLCSYPAEYTHATPKFANTP